VKIILLFNVLQDAFRSVNKLLLLHCVSLYFWSCIHDKAQVWGSSYDASINSSI